MDGETKRILELFITKANELHRRDFLKYFESQGKVGLNYHVNDDGVSELEIVGPDEDTVLALTTTLRLFIQEGEPISFRSLSKIIDNDSSLSEDWKKNFAEVRKHLNSYLDERPVKTEPPSETPTRREIVDVFINGDIFHVKDEAKRNTFEKWLKSPIEFTLLVNEFDLSIDHVAQIILHAADLVKTALEQNP